ncbi:Membrane protease YdiL, CAAX protease family [Paenibacillus tianmuensis]|uniref:Membrane protease YdiL, CAAX protease family n=1 Tax=Paenibacillus tianmuensis TaxID=624147 RepID=A0A1G4PF15_9BACL|nr:type II CAAX endopeptidase family protein [Paenibacillus tianmuensis]SCW30698.1 Membrane protease YdiL, CAAX protease family [Paenibacillus tianmuensis]
MLKRFYSATPLPLLAVIGLLLYFGVIIVSPFFRDTERVDQAPPNTPEVSKQQAEAAATDFVRSRFKLSPESQTNVLYQAYTAISGYLQKEHLYNQYAKRYGDQYPLEYYEVEINDKRYGTTYYVAVNYKTLQIFSWERSKSPAAKSDAVSSSEADPARLAEQTIREMGYAPEQFTRSGEQGRDRSGALVYVSKTEQIGAAKLELRLGVSGGQAVSFKPVFPAPDSFISWQQAQDERSALMTRISMAASLMMTFAALIVIIRYRRQVRFGRGTVLTMLFLAIYLTNNFNMLPAFRTMHGSGPSEPEAAIYLLIMNIFITLMAGSTYLSFLAGRQLWLNRGWNAWPVWRDPQFGSETRTAMVRGYLICLFILGVQQVMLFIASEAFDVWAVSEPTDSIYNMRVPGLFPLMAWAAAISEEAVYRLLGIALVLKLTRSRALAVLLPSIIWAMSHTQYPIYPVYTRLIEVTVLGLVFGWAFLRYGFLTAMFAHAAMDSILMGLSLMYTGEPLQIALGALYLLVPAAVGWIIAWLHGRFNRRPPAASLPGAPPLPEASPDSGRLTPIKFGPPASH